MSAHMIMISLYGGTARGIIYIDTGQNWFIYDNLHLYYLNM